MISRQTLTSISPVDGRYYPKVANLSNYFSEFALIRYRIEVEIEYFIALCEIPLPQLTNVSGDLFKDLRKIYENFSMEDAEEVKNIEKTTNHDVKAVEYFIKSRMDSLGLVESKEFVHFGLTSQDVNNTAVPLSLKEGLTAEYFPLLGEFMELIDHTAQSWRDIPMLARTHGQPASPTRLGKEFEIFRVRMEEQIRLLQSIPFSAKFGGATGNMNAHFVAYPEIEWHDFAQDYVEQKLGMHRSFPTTQIEHYDHLAAIFDGMKRVNTILIDLSRDIWSYISMNYFKQKINKEEVGSSAMPHKVNPIDFENAEGNLGIANALFEHLSSKLPVSRLQRDLTDSTVLRNIGVPIAHTMISLHSLVRGWKKLEINEEAIRSDLENNWAVVAEAIQTVLRRIGYSQPYEKLKELTRKNQKITQESIISFIKELDVDDSVKEELLKITPFTYTGR